MRDNFLSVSLLAWVIRLNGRHLDNKRADTRVTPAACYLLVNCATSAFMLKESVMTSLFAGIK